MSTLSEFFLLATQSRGVSRQRLVFFWSSTGKGVVLSPIYTHIHNMLTHIHTIDIDTHT